MLDSTELGGGGSAGVIDGPGVEPGAGDAFEPLRAEVRRIAAEEGKSISALATEAGIPNGTFSPWLGGKYPGRSDNIAKAVRLWLDTRQARQERQMTLPPAPAFMLTPTAKQFTGALQHAQFAPDMVMITGGPGVGKTITAQAYARRTPNVWVLTAEPCFRTPRVLLDEVAALVNVPTQPSTPKLSRTIVTRLRGTGGLLIVDEAQHLPSMSLDQLRTLHDKAEIGLALVGNEQVYSRVEGSARTPEYAQLFSRVGMRVPKQRPTKRDIDMLLDAWGVGPWGMGPDGSVRALLHVVAGKPGALRGMTKVLRMASTFALADGAPAVGAEHVRAAWSNLSASSIGGAGDATGVAP